MREFFKPWRRKAGVLTLVMACALIGMWLRSQLVEESAGLTVGARKYSLFSAGGELAFYFATPSLRPGLRYYWWSREFQHGYRLGGRLVVWYMDFAAPLTVLSAYLLLSKPRSAAPRTTEPAPTSGA